MTWRTSIKLCLLAVASGLLISGCASPLKPLPIRSAILNTASTPSWQLAIIGSTEDFSDDCKLDLVATSRRGDGKHHYAASLRGKYSACGFFGPLQIVAGEGKPGEGKPSEGTNGTLVFVEGVRGGDANHTGPVVMVFRLSAQGMRKLGEQELFHAQYRRRAGRIVSVSGNVLFTFSPEADDPLDAPAGDKIFVPATLRPGCGGICVRPAVTAKQRAAIIRRFESRRAELLKNKDYYQEDGDYVKGLSRRFHALLGMRHSAGPADSPAAGVE